MSRPPARTSVIRIGEFTLFGSGFGMPRYHDVGDWPKDYGITKSTLWLTCRAKHRDGSLHELQHIYRLLSGETAVIEVVKRNGREVSRSDVTRSPYYRKIVSYLDARSDSVRAKPWIAKKLPQPPAPNSPPNLSPIRETPSGSPRRVEKSDTVRGAPLTGGNHARKV